MMLCSTALIPRLGAARQLVVTTRTTITIGTTRSICIVCFSSNLEFRVVQTQVISMWDKETGGLPEIGLCDRLYVHWPQSY